MPLVIGVAASAVIALLLLRSSRHTTGGAANPKAAVQSLADSISAGDLAATADVIAPDELHDVKDLVTSMQGAAVRLGVTSIASKNGGTLKFDIANLDDETLGKSASKVTIDGSASIAGDDQPTGFVQGLIGTGHHSDRVTSKELTFRTKSGKSIKPFVIVIKEGDGWFVSPLLTAGEYARVALDLPSGDYDQIAGSKKSTPAATPKAALQTMMDAIPDLDANQFSKALAPGEARLFRVFDSAISKEIDNINRDNGNRAHNLLSVDNIQLGDGKTADVKVLKSFDATTTRTFSDGQRSTRSYTLDNDCFSRTSSGGDNDRCIVSRAAAKKHLGLGDLEISFVKSGSGYLVSPLATLTDALKTVARNVDQQTFDQFFGVEYLETPTAATADRAIPLDFSAKPYAVFQLPAHSDITVNAQNANYDEFEQSDNSRWERTYLDGPSEHPIRIVVKSEDYCSNLLVDTCGGDTKTATTATTAAESSGSTVPSNIDPKASIVTFSSIYRQTLPAAGIVHAVIQPDASAVYTFPPTADGGPYAITDGNDSDASLRGNVLTIRNNSAQPKEYNITVQEGHAFGFDNGSSSTNVTAGSSGSTVSLHVTAGQHLVVTFRVTGGGRANIRSQTLTPSSDNTSDSSRDDLEYTFDNINASGTLDFVITAVSSDSVNVSVSASAG